MDILAIDLGTYSVKFLELFIERRNITLKYFHQVPLIEVIPTNDKEISINELQYEIIKGYLQERNFNGKIIFQIPTNIITSRYLSFPIKKIKKAEMMIPFQLDENLPFSVTQAHYTSVVLKSPNGLVAIINIARTEDFDHFYNELSQFQILPSQITSELFSLNSYLFLPGNLGIKKFTTSATAPYAILDLGHNFSKIFFISKYGILSNHTSNIAGAAITESIAATYNIDTKEATSYKHKNCFFLTEKQYDSVTEDQKDFAILMKNTISPLINDLKKWMMGYRVKNGEQINNIYITGGTSNIKNIGSFLTKMLEINVEPLDPFNFIKRQKIELDQATKNIAANCFFMGIANSSQISPGNFLKGNYSPISTETLPLHSTIFISFRLSIICLLLIIPLLAEHFILRNHHKLVSKHLRKNFKSTRLTSLKLPASLNNILKRDPEKALKTIIKREDDIKNELKTFLAATEIDATKPLLHLSKVISINNLFMESFESNKEGMNARFKSSDPKQILALEQVLQKSKYFQNANIEILKDKKTLVIDQVE